jgi:radical SAM protein with 4Fe4S-binding SPASM domain
MYIAAELFGLVFSAVADSNIVYNEIGKSCDDCRWQRLCKEGCNIASGADSNIVGMAL